MLPNVLLAYDSILGLLCIRVRKKTNLILSFSGSIDSNNQLIIKGRFQQKQIENVLRRYISKLSYPNSLLPFFGPFFGPNSFSTTFVFEKWFNDSIVSLLCVGNKITVIYCFTIIFFKIINFIGIGLY